jgi:hypothetical protein
MSVRNEENNEGENQKEGIVPSLRKIDLKKCRQIYLIIFKVPAL